MIKLDLPTTPCTLTLTADAVIDGDSLARFQAAGGAIDLNGFSLTITPTTIKTEWQPPGGLVRPDKRYRNGKHRR